MKLQLDPETFSIIKKYLPRCYDPFLQKLQSKEIVIDGEVAIFMLMDLAEIEKKLVIHQRMKDSEKISHSSEQIAKALKIA